MNAPLRYWRRRCSPGQAPTRSVTAGSSDRVEAARWPERTRRTGPYIAKSGVPASFGLAGYDAVHDVTDELGDEPAATCRGVYRLGRPTHCVIDETADDGVQHSSTRYRTAGFHRVPWPGE
jgi:hypothetical protein